jgi:hypothetical protein
VSDERSNSERKACMSALAWYKLCSDLHLIGVPRKSRKLYSPLCGARAYQTPIQDQAGHDLAYTSWAVHSSSTSFPPYQNPALRCYCNPRLRGGRYTQGRGTLWAGGGWNCRAFRWLRLTNRFGGRSLGEGGTLLPGRLGTADGGARIRRELQGAEGINYLPRLCDHLLRWGSRRGR